jgi:hypothetical protein
VDGVVGGRGRGWEGGGLDHWPIDVSYSCVRAWLPGVRCERDAWLVRQVRVRAHARWTILLFFNDTI